MYYIRKGTLLFCWVYIIYGSFIIQWGLLCSDWCMYAYKTYRFRNILAIDISETIIHVMQQQYKDFSGVTFTVMDVRELNAIPSGSISVAIDKGCIDAVFCSTNFLTDTRQVFKEIYRVLGQEGVFASFSHAPANCRVPFLKSVDWAIDCCTCAHGVYYMIMISYIYSMISL